MTLDARSTKEIATAFTTARLRGEHVSNYPGTPPVTLAEAYNIQDAAIDIWPSTIAGWKVGGIDGSAADNLGVRKLVGPVFEDQIIPGINKTIKMPVFQGGFAAVEGEVVIIVKNDAPQDKRNWSLAEAKAMIGAVHFGVEIASSPFAKINEMGPLVTISDFGNNCGLIVGSPIPEWEKFETQKWEFETSINEQSVGINSSGNAGGPLEAFRFCLENTALRSKPLKKGMFITTGAVTGVHQAFIGQNGWVRCMDLEAINIELIAKDLVKEIKTP